MSAGNAPLDSDEAHPSWSCVRKKQYPSQDIAERMAATITSQATDGGRVRAYGCRHCGLWHIGSVPGVRRVETIVSRPKVARRVATRRGSSSTSYGSTRRRHKRERYQNNSSEDDD